MGDGVINITKYLSKLLVLKVFDFVQNVMNQTQLNINYCK